MSIVHEGCPEQLKRLRGAPSFRYIGSLPKDLTGIYHGGNRRRQIGGRGDPGQAGIRKKHGPLPSAHGNHFEIASNTEIFIKQNGQLSDGQPVAHRYGIAAHKGDTVRRQAVALGRNPVNGIGSVQHNDFFIMAFSGFHAKRQGVDKGVYPSPRILQIHDQGIDGGQHFPIRRPGFSVQADDRNVQNRIDHMVRFDHVVLLFAEKTMLRGIQGCQFSREPLTDQHAAMTVPAVH